MKMKKELKVVTGKFAKVATGNATFGFILDDDDVQTRADAAYGDYYGDTGIVYERGLEGAAVFAGNNEVSRELYISEKFANESVARRLS